MRVGEIWEAKNTDALVEILELRNELVWYQYLGGDVSLLYPPVSRETFVKFWDKYHGNA